MSKYIVTDPCYILPVDVWHKCCEVLSEYDGDEKYQRFDEEVTKALRAFSGDDKACATGTGYGDWCNVLIGPGVIFQNFCADAGMFCVCKLTEPVEKLFRMFSYGISVALFEMGDNIEITFDYSDRHWTRVIIKDKDTGNEISSSK